MAEERTYLADHHRVAINLSQIADTLREIAALGPAPKEAVQMVIQSIVILVNQQENHLDDLYREAAAVSDEAYMQRNREFTKVVRTLKIRLERLVTDYKQVNPEGK